jgi:DNA-binding NarL/FixJ family response regulator
LLEHALRTVLIAARVDNSPIRVSLEDDMSTTEPLKVMLVEDHIAFRQALTYLLSDDTELEVVAQAGSLAEAREALDGGGIQAPLDVAVLDLALPDGDGRELIGELKRSHPDIRIMVLSATVWAEEAEEVRRAGADAVLDKVRSYLTIADEVRRLGDGG